MQSELRDLITRYGLQEVCLALQEEMSSLYLDLHQIFADQTPCIYGIYKTMSTTCIYVGCTLNLTNRISWHHQESTLFPTRKLYKTIRENGGWSSYSFRILETLQTHTQIHHKESEWIQRLSPIGNSIKPPQRTYL